MSHPHRSGNSTEANRKGSRKFPDAREFWKASENPGQDAGRGPNGHLVWTGRRATLGRLRVDPEGVELCDHTFSTWGQDTG